ncbi:MAG: SDR family NAD(P)-dependent oxidoreductase [Bacteroidota bacterium]
MLDGKVAVITGASSGIGASLARLLAKEHAAVVLAARRKDKLESLARQITTEGGRAIPIRCDVTVREDAEQLIHDAVQEFGRIDILINNAGRGHFAAVEDTTDDVMEKMFAVNVFPLWYTTRPALPLMKKQRSGHIINIASMAGKVGYPYNSAYVAAKHACVGFTMALRQELFETGVHASVVCPAGVLTEWALATEGGSMLEFFSESGPAIKRIAAERKLRLPQIEGVLPPDAIAQRILECIYKPVAEVYTHTGSKEFATLALQNREESEQMQVAVVLGEREVYERMKKRGNGVVE